MPLSELKKIEEIELKYLTKFYHFLKFAEDEMFLGFQTKEAIRNDWVWLYGSQEWWGISDFAVWAERIVYALLNGKGIWQPNSAPVGSDLFFELPDAYIHIDMKTVQQENIWDFTSTIFIGENQNSYKWIIKKRNWISEEYTPALPTFYNKWTPNQKICLSYFITILYNRETLDIMVISIDCMPNGELESHYKDRVLSAGKNRWKARFNLKEVNKFELLDNSPSRIKVVFFKENMEEKYKKQLKLFKTIYDAQK